jgi:hypothetical protein
MLRQSDFGTTRSADSFDPRGRRFYADRLGLTAIEEAGRKEDNSDHEGEAGMEDVMQTQAEERIRKPRGEAQKPYPRCLLEHPHSSMLQ